MIFVRFTLTLFLFLLPLMTVIGISSNCAIGTWKDLDGSSDRDIVSKVSLVTHSPQEWLDHACPTEIIQHSCYAHGNEERARLVQNRKWVANNPACIDLDKNKFLETFRNRNVVFMGDSIMMEIWQFLGCFLPRKTADIRVNWHQHTEKTVPGYNNRTCPFGEFHCHVHGGRLHYPHYNVSIYFHLALTYETGEFSRVMQNYTLSTDDYVIFNWGLHFHVKSSHEAVFGVFKDDWNTMKTRPRVLYLQSLPQHFDTFNGYYRPNTNMNCHRIMNYNQKRYDWRNAIAEAHLKEVDIPIIRIAEALYSQFDAHIESSKITEYRNADCTHWCLSSGVNFYITQMIMNIVITMSSAPNYVTQLLDQL